MAVVKNLMVRMGADFSSAQKSMKNFQGTMQNFQNSISSKMKAIGGLLAMAGASFGVASATKSAMEYESAILQINRTMQDSAKIFQDWAKQNASSYGMAQVEAMKYGGVFSNLISGFAKDTKHVQNYTTDLLKAGAITAAATGRTIEDTMDRIRSGMLGSTEAIEDLGINVNIAMIESTEAFKNFANGKSWAKLDFQTQQQIRLFAILEQATTKYGDTVANSTAAKQAMFVASLKNVQLSLGQAFLPIYNIVLPALTKFMNLISSAVSVVAQFSQALFGKSSTANINGQAQAISAEAAAVDGLGDSYSKASKAAKGALAGFDEVNSLGGGTESDAGASSGVIGGTSGLEPLNVGGFASATVEVSDKVKEMADKVKQAYVSMREMFQSNSDLIIAALAGVGTAIALAFGVSKWGSIATVIKTAATAIGAVIGAISIPVALVIAAIGALVGAFIYFYRTNEKFRETVHLILQKIGETAVWLWQNVLVPFGAWMVSVFVKAWDIITQSATWLWKNVLVPFGSFLLELWNTVIVPLALVLTDMLGVAFSFIADVAKMFWLEVLVPLGKALSEMFGPAVEAVSAVVTFLWENVFVPLAQFIDGTMLPIWQKVIEVITFLWKNVFKPLAEYLQGTFKIVFKTVFDVIGVIIEGAKNIFIGLMNFITGVFTGDWGKAWEGVKKVFKSIFDSFVGIVKTPINMIIDMINQVISGFNSISINVPDWVPSIGGKSFGVNIPSIPRLARGGIVDTATNMGNYIAGEAGREMIVPLENTSFTDKIANALGAAVSTSMQITNGSNNNKDIVLQVDGVTFARLMNGYTAKENARIGGSMITVT